MRKQRTRTHTHAHTHTRIVEADYTHVYTHAYIPTDGRTHRQRLRKEMRRPVCLLQQASERKVRGDGGWIIPTGTQRRRREMRRRLVLLLGCKVHACRPKWTIGVRLALKRPGWFAWEAYNAPAGNC